MRRLLTVLLWEFRRTAANRAFVVMTVIGPFLILGMTIVPTLLIRGQGLQSGTRVALSGGDDAGFAALAATLSPAGIVLERAQGDGVAAKASVASGELAAWLELEPDWELSGRARLHTKNGSDFLLLGTVKGALGNLLREARSRASGIDPARLAPILEPPAVTMVTGAEGAAGGAEAPPGDDGSGRYITLLFTALVFVMMIYMTTLLYGQMIGRSVVLEKSSRTVEIMLSSVSPRELLFGKVFGLGAAALLQYGIWAGVGILVATIFGPALGISVPAGLSPANLGWMVLFFVLAFFIYATAYAAVGAAAEDEQQLGQLAWPIIVFLVIPIVFVSYFVMNPDGVLCRVLSIFPLTSPIVMFIRVLVSPPAAWELLLCVAILLATIWGTGILAAKVFRVGILMTGKRGSFGEIWRWMREPGSG